MNKEESGNGKPGKESSALEPDATKGEVKDVQLDRAVDLLKGWEIFKNRYLDRSKAS